MNEHRKHDGCSSEAARDKGIKHSVSTTLTIVNVENETLLQCPVLPACTEQFELWHGALPSLYILFQLENDISSFICEQHNQSSNSPTTTDLPTDSFEWFQRSGIRRHVHSFIDILS